MRAKLWFRLQIGGTQWGIYFGGPLDKLEGLCDSHKARVYLSPRLTRSRVYDVLFHELAHASNFMCGADKSLAGALGADEEDMYDVEEVFVSTAMHHLFVTLSQAGWLQLPEIPEWIK